MRAFAEVTLVPSEGKGISPDLMARMRAVIEELDQREDIYWTRQFENADLLHGYDAIGDELMAQIPGTIDLFRAAAGTAGMIVGASEAFRRAGIDPRIVVLEPAGSPILSQGISGAHRIEGVGPGFIPPLLDEGLYDDVMTVEEDQPGIVDEGQRDEEPLLLPAGEVGEGALALLLQPPAGQQRVDVDRIGGKGCEQPQRLAHLHPSRQRGRLQLRADQLPQLVRLRLRVQPQYAQRPAVRLARALETLNGRRLAGPIRS